MSPNPTGKPQRTIGRYVLFGELASGGMATVHLGRLLGEVGFARTVAIKRLHPHFAKDPEFVSMFLDEARLAARIRHPNVVPTLDVVSLEGELFLVMEYVDGESLANLLRCSQAVGETPPVRVVVAVLLGVLHGLHAAHEATSERGEPLNIVHRDVSPQNILVGVDGVSRVLDFGIAKAAWRLQTTRDGQLKGKLAYMAPEQFERGDVDRRVDVYAASVVLWEALTGRRLFRGDGPQLMAQVTTATVVPPGQIVKGIPPELDEVVLRGSSRDVEARFATARDMALALERAAPAASQREVGEWVRSQAAKTLQERADRVAEVESVSSVDIAADVVVAQAEATGPDEPVVRPATPLADAPPSTDPSMSMSRPSASGRRTVLAATMGLVSLVAVVGVGARVLTRESAPTPPRDAPVVADTPSEVASVVVPPVLASAPPASASAPPASASSLPPPRPARPSGVGRAAAPARGAPTRSCDPPYTVDVHGIHHPKMECM